MADVHHFAYGWVTPTFAYALSFLGSLLGLVCTARARASDSPRRRGWLLVMAAWAIGGTGIWVMHFMAMIGFNVPGSAMRYDVPTTVASFLIAVVMVGVGLFIVGMGPRTLSKVLVGGPVTGVSVALMHYAGMAAMHVHGDVGYDRTLVVASFAIAVVAATVALWFTVVIRGMVPTILAAGVMGVAVCGMHYTGMAALRIQLADTADQLPGVAVDWFIAPILLFVVVVAFALANAVMAMPSAEEQQHADRLRTAMDQRTLARPHAGAGGTGGGFGGFGGRR